MKKIFTLLLALVACCVTVKADPNHRKMTETSDKGYYEWDFICNICDSIVSLDHNNPIQYYGEDYMYSQTYYYTFLGETVDIGYIETYAVTPPPDVESYTTDLPKETYSSNESVARFSTTSPNVLQVVGYGETCISATIEGNDEFIGSNDQYSGSKKYAFMLHVNTPGVTAFGTCGINGDNLTWELSSEGVLTISGTGDMADYEYDGCFNNYNAPWYKYKESILSVVIENGVTNIGQGAFTGCDNVTSIDIPTSVTSIRNDAFVGCSNLTSAPIGEGVVNIEWNAYEACSGITSVTIPASVQTIGDWAFVHCGVSWGGCGGAPISPDAPKRRKIGGTCAAITIITSYAVTPPTLGQDVFGWGENTETPLYVPGSSIDAYKAADGWKDFINILPIPGTEIEPCVTASGTCGAEGDNLTWELSCDRVLTISGEGEMVNYGDGNLSPWDSNTSIQSIIFEEGVTSVGTWAFRNCSGITSISIPSTMAKVEGWGASVGVNNVTSVTVAPNNPIYDSRENCNAIIETATNKLLRGCQTTVIPQSVTSIGYYAFMDCSTLTSIEIPDGVTSIGEYAFTACSGLTSLEIPEKVTKIGTMAFNYCTGLTSITCKAVTPPSLTGSYVFRQVDKSIPFYVPAESIEAYQAADQWKDFTNIQAIPGTEPCVTASGTCGAQGDNLTWELSCDSVLTISGTGEMSDWESYNDVPWYANKNLIKSIIIENGVTSIGDYAFCGCYNLTSIEIPNSVTSIEASAFNGCSRLTSIDIPNSVTSIGQYAFFQCEGLISIEIPNSVTSIGKWAFCGCYNLTSIEISNSVTSIEDHVFKSCRSLTSIEIPNSVTSIGEGAFAFCSSLTSIEIPNSVTNIGREVFYACSSLTSITNHATIPQSINANVFGGNPAVDKSTCILYVPAESIDAYQAADVWKEFTNILPISGTDIQKYQITWLNYDGTKLQSGEVEEGVVPIYTGETPTKPSDAQYTYTFAGWTPEIVAATENATYTATFENTLNKYTITWLDEDRNTIKEDQIEYGTTPVFSGETPTKASDAEYSYEFIGWLPKIKPVTGDAWYITDFNRSKLVSDKVYTVNINGENCSLRISNEVPAGTTLQVEAVADDCFEFQGWSDNETANPRTIDVTEDAELTAEFNKVRYTITGKSENAGGHVQIQAKQ